MGPSGVWGAHRTLSLMFGWVPGTALAGGGGVCPIPQLALCQGGPQGHKLQTVMEAEVFSTVPRIITSCSLSDAEKGSDFDAVKASQ